MPRNALHQACRKEDFNKAVEVINSVDFNEIDESHSTPFHLACINGNEKIVDLLLKTKNLNLNPRGYFIDVSEDGEHYERSYVNQTPFHLACSNGHTQIVQRLISTAGIELDPKDKYGKTPFYLACCYGHDKIAELLIKTKKIELNSKDAEGFTPFQVSILQGRSEVVKLLIKTEGIEINEKDKSGKTVFHWACSGGDIEVIKMISQIRGINLDAKDNHDNYPFFLACKNGHTTAVKFLLALNDLPLVNSKNDEQRTPLHFACAGGHFDIVELLIKIDGIDLNPKDVNGKTPFRLACDQRHSKVIKFLADTEGVDLSPILLFKTIKGEPLLIEIDVTNQPRNSFSRQVKLEGSFTDDDLRLLKDNFYNNAEFEDQRGMSLLMTAMHVGCLSVAKFLFSKELSNTYVVKNNINKADKLRRTALIHACYRGHSQCVSYLLQEGADFSLVDKDNMSPLMYAAMEGHIEVVLLLLNYNSTNVSATNTWFRSAKDLARKYITNKRKRNEMVTLISKYEKKGCFPSGSEKMNDSIKEPYNSNNGKEVEHVFVEMKYNNPSIINPNPLMKIEMKDEVVNDQIEKKEGDNSTKNAEGLCKCKLLQALKYPLKCIIGGFSSFIDFAGSSWFFLLMENNFFILEPFGVLIASLYTYFMADYKIDENHDNADNKNHNLDANYRFLVGIGILFRFLVPFTSVAVSIATSSSDWNYLHQQNYSSITIEPIYCFSVHGTNLQPYWIIMIFSIFGQMVNSFLTFLIKFGTTKESFNLSKPSQVGARLSKMNGWIQLISFITLSSYLNQSFGPPSPPTDPSKLFSVMHSVNGSTSFDVTWILNTESQHSQGWRLYEQLYIKYLSGGVGMFLLTSYSNMAKYKENIFDLDHLKYLNQIEHTKIGAAVIFLLPSFVTHIVPMMFLFPHYVLSIYALWLLSNRALDLLLNWCKCSSFLSFFIRAFKKLTFTFTITVIFQTFFVWAVLVYSLPVPLSPSQYLSIFWMELSMRNTECYLQPYLNDFNRVAGLACAHGVASSVSYNNNIGANEIVNLLSWLLSG